MAEDKRTRAFGMRVPIDLWLEIEAIAVRERRPVTQVMEWVLRDGLAARQRAAQEPK